MVKIKDEKYKGFNIEFFISRKGFNQYKLTITKYRNKGYQDEEFFLKIIDTYTPVKKEALDMAKNYIDQINVIDWKSQGLQKSPYAKKH
jgi:hypothetical protein